MTQSTVRWKQRFQNFEKAFLFLKSTVGRDEYSPLEIGGLVQAFEFTFELAWKTMKDYLDAQGIDAKSPRETIKEAFAMQIIADGHVWIEMLEKRNELSHTYNFEVAAKAQSVINEDYFPAINQVYESLKKLL